LQVHIYWGKIRKGGHRAGREGERGEERGPKGGRGPEEGWAAMGRPSFTWLEEWLSSRSLRTLDI
jgi:hypothetical protein